VNTFIKEDLGIDDSVLTAIGVRAFDNRYRHFAIDKYGAITEKRKVWYPIYDWDVHRLYDEIKEAGCKLPVDYKIWGKSFDGLDYRFIKPLKENFPRDYEKLKDFYPLIDAELKRYELKENY
jgi:hypothetical protein